MSFFLIILWPNQLKILNMKYLFTKTLNLQLVSMQSQHVYITYVRKPLDASILIRHVQLNLQAKKLFCLNPNYKRQIFTERFPDFLTPYWRLTIGLEEVFLQLSLSMRAEALSRLLFKLEYNRSGHVPLVLLKCIDSIRKN